MPASNIPAINSRKEVPAKPESKFEITISLREKFITANIDKRIKPTALKKL